MLRQLAYVSLEQYQLVVAVSSSSISIGSSISSNGSSIGSNSVGRVRQTHVRGCAHVQGETTATATTIASAATATASTVVAV